jgi:NAD(P)-dependent dehydrogenase (short-subunit alcohol dehydrogenase family)
VAMSDLTGRSAVVTGGGSGIGAALTRRLVSAGAHVTVADVDVDAAQHVVDSLEGPGTAIAVPLDVRDAAAVAEVVDEVVVRHGRLDLMFNNAGITFGGETHELTLHHWDSIIDVNIRGVVHGVAAAYPVMVEQHHGHIVNTASMGGLMAAGLITSYVMTKHAVVGLSLALRTEAAAHGVGVTALCPAAVETPLLEKGELGRFRGRDYYLKGQGIKRPLEPDALAKQALEAVAANRALLVTPRQARVAWRVGRLAPSLVSAAGTRFVAKQRRLQQAGTVA